MGSKLESLFGRPQDMEWTFYKDRLVVLQSRPITSAGFKETDDMLFDPKFIEPSTFAYDTIYNPQQTRFLIAAKQRGCRKTSNGLSMLLYQGAKAFELWFERKAPVELMRQQLMHPRAFS